MFVASTTNAARRSSAHRDEARRIAANIAKLPELLLRISAGPRCETEPGQRLLGNEDAKRTFGQQTV
jgi:hypothetical protein